MRKLSLMVGLGLLEFAVLAGNGAIGFRFESDHHDCLYRLGEEATITVTATNGAGEAVKSGFARIAIDNYGRKCQKLIGRHEFANGNPLVLKGCLDRPGFLRVSVNGCDDAGVDVSARWSVGYEPDKIRPASERPADFDRFWDDAVAKFAKEVAVDATMVKDDVASAACSNEWNCYRLAVGTVPRGRFVRGVVTIPTAGDGPWPVIFSVAGAGPGEWDFVRRDGCASVTINVVDYPSFPDKDHPVEQLYEEQNRRWSGKTGKDVVNLYCHGDLTKEPEDYFYYGAILGINRAVDWVLDRPEIGDAKDVRYSGMSQGGAFGIYLCALNRRITRALIAEPALTDVCGFLEDERQSGWPILPEQYEKREFYANMVRMLPYFDTAHFAPRVNVPVRCFVGFVDQCCPPHAVWAGFNCLGSKDRKIVNVPGLDHGSPVDLWRGAWKQCDESWQGTRR